MMRKLLYKITNDLPCRYINHGEGPYMERYYVGTFCGLRSYLHRFVASDADGIHSHPFKLSFSLLLAGWYFEDRWVYPHLKALFEKMKKTDLYRVSFPENGKVVRGVKRFFNAIGPCDFHRVVLPSNGKDVWTLFVHTGRVQPWGFLRPIDGTDNWKGTYEYVSESDPKDPAFSTWHLTEPKGHEMRRRFAEIPMGRAAPADMKRATGREGAGGHKSAAMM